MGLASALKSVGMSSPPSSGSSSELLPSPIRRTEQMDVEDTDEGTDEGTDDPNPLVVEPSPMGALQSVGTGDEPDAKIENATDAVRLYYWHQTNLPAYIAGSLRSKIVSKLVPWFSAAATPAELALLQDRTAETGE